VALYRTAYNGNYFLLQGKGTTQLKSTSALCRKGKLKLSVAAPTPVRRLRLRGDWSDTGPDARPEREAGGRGGNFQLDVHKIYVLNWM